MEIKALDLQYAAHAQQKNTRPDCCQRLLAVLRRAFLAIKAYFCPQRTLTPIGARRVAVTSEISSPIVQPPIQPSVHGSTALPSIQDIREKACRFTGVESLRRNLMVLDQAAEIDTQKILVLANFFGNGIFEGKKLDNGAALDGLIPARAVEAYIKHLDNYALSCPDSEKEGLRDIQVAMRDLYFGSLLQIAHFTGSCQKNNYAKSIEQGILDVHHGRKKCFYFLMGFKGHFVPMRVEKEGSHTRLGLFNLGSGSQLNLPHTGGLVDGELRLGTFKTVEGGDRKLFIDDFIEGRGFPVLCDNMAQVSLEGNEVSWFQLMGALCPSQKDRFDAAVRRANMRTIIPGRRQEMGDCTCKGQWTLLEKEFARRGLNFASFQDFAMKSALDTAKAQFNYVEQQGTLFQARYVLQSTLTTNDVIRICDATASAIQRKRRRCEFQTTENLIDESGYSISTRNFYKLFDRSRRLVIGRNPEIANDWNCAEPGQILICPNAISRRQCHIYLSEDAKQLYISQKGQGRLSILMKDGSVCQLSQGGNCTVNLDEIRGISLDGVGRLFQFSL